MYSGCSVQRILILDLVCVLNVLIKPLVTVLKSELGHVTLVFNPFTGYRVRGACWLLGVQVQ